VFNPNPGSTPAGYVGAFNSQAGASNESDAAVALLFSGSVTATGTRGSQQYTIQIPLRFVPKVTQSPTDTNDYTWNITYGDNPNGGVDVTANPGPRLAMWLSRDTVIDGAETPDTFQRYTQNNPIFVGGQDTFTNTDTTTGAVKDATDPPNAPLGVDAAGRDLGFYFGWRDQNSLGGGTVLVDNFTVGGLLEADETTLREVPEPSSALLLLGGSGVLFFRRRRVR
jgi:hypothetical protein